MTNFLYLSSLIIQDYASLPEEERLAFESSAAGKIFVQFIKGFLQAFEELENSFYWWHRMNGVAAVKREELANTFLREKENLLIKINNADEYKSLKRKMAKNKNRKFQHEWCAQPQLFAEHINELGQFFPLLYFRKPAEDHSVIDSLHAQYSINTELQNTEEEQLADLLFHCMQAVCQAEIDFISLVLFNKKQADEMALAVLNAFNEKASLDFDNWFQNYKTHLYQYFIAQLKGCRIPIKPLGITDDLYNSLSYLWKNTAVEKMNQFVSKLADAHGFIQATGFSTQNESSFLAILDIYNYARFHEQISETRSLFMSFLSPFYPLLYEYKNIALYEKNPYWKLFRMVMPLVVVVAFIILVAAALTPLALPELAFAAVLLPSFLLGLGLANYYVTSKNIIYNTVRGFYYGDPFAIPEFQVNKRMQTAFATPELALQIRAFYIEELKHCDALEKHWNFKHSQGILSQEDINSRKANLEKRRQLCLEWYDIHSNKDLSYQQASVIAFNRLQQTQEQEYLQLEKLLWEEQDLIKESVALVTADIQATITNHNKIPAYEAKAEAATIKVYCRYGLFKQPQCFKHKTHLEHLSNLAIQIGKGS